MDQVASLLRELIGKMDTIASTLEEISGKLDNVDGAYSIDDVVSAINSAADDIVGGTRYSLTDLHGELSNITTELSGINTTLMLQD